MYSKTWWLTVVSVQERRFDSAALASASIQLSLLVTPTHHEEPLSAWIIRIFSLITGSGTGERKARNRGGFISEIYERFYRGMLELLKYCGDRVWWSVDSMCNCDFCIPLMVVMICPLGNHTLNAHSFTHSQGGINQNRILPVCLDERWQRKDLAALIKVVIMHALWLKGQSPRLLITKTNNRVSIAQI